MSHHLGPLSFSSVEVENIRGLDTTADDGWRPERNQGIEDDVFILSQRPPFRSKLGVKIEIDLLHELPYDRLDHPLSAREKL